MLLLALHMPDGFVPLPVAVLGWILAALALTAATARARCEMDDALVPRMGLLASCVLVAQTLQFPVPGGTSAHLQGSALAGLLLGPWASLFVLTAVLGVQAFVFGDGGVLTMGWNIVNMGILGCWTAVALYGRLRPRYGLAFASFAASWVSVMLATVATCAELGYAGTSPLAVSLPAMLTVQTLVALGEAAATAGAIALLHARRPALLEVPAPLGPGLLAALLLAGAGFLPGLGQAVLGVPFPVAACVLSILIPTAVLSLKST